MTTDVVTERNFDRVFPASKRERFWERVERAMDEVFAAPAGPAKTYRRAVESAPVEEQLLVYHDEPLKIAADLAGVPTISEDHLEKYRQLIGANEPSAPALPDSP
jgi:hypothetical protein